MCSGCKSTGLKHVKSEPTFQVNSIMKTSSSTVQPGGCDQTLYCQNSASQITQDEVAENTAVSASRKHVTYSEKSDIIV